MPAFTTAHSRPTKEIHAPWWSSKRDAFGRFVEHVIIYTSISDDDLRDQLTGIENIAASATGFFDLLFSFRDGYLARMIVEMTDAQGNVMPVSAESIHKMEPKDIQYINEQINVACGVATPTEKGGSGWKS